MPTAMPTLQFTTETHWHGTTRDGYRSFSRAHDACAEPATAALRLSADESYVGDRDLLNPEQLLVMAASSCLMLTVLALASSDGMDVVDYRDNAVGTLNADIERAGVEIVLRPTITLSGDVEVEVVEHLVRRAHRRCFIANSLARPTTVELHVEVHDGDHRIRP